MKQLNIYTSKYENELRDFAAKEAAAGTIAIKHSRTCEKRRLFELCCVCLNYKTLPESLTALLMDIAEEENPVYRHSPRLREMAQSVRSSLVHKQEVKQMRAFLAENKALHLEGYATFRLSEYREKLDMMIYTLVKKIKFSKED
ncbi:MAG: hypothetical protein FWB91_01590 [Defluviitaleaceae bacterium]|nr:hypothetical protein [Defluviitaleaceae bacterium]